MEGKKSPRPPRITWAASQILHADADLLNLVKDVERGVGPGTLPSRGKFPGRRMEGGLAQASPSDLPQGTAWTISTPCRLVSTVSVTFSGLCYLIHLGRCRQDVPIHTLARDLSYIP